MRKFRIATRFAAAAATVALAVGGVTPVTDTAAATPRAASPVVALDDTPQTAAPALVQQDAAAKAKVKPRKPDKCAGKIKKRIKIPTGKGKTAAEAVVYWSSSTGGTTCLVTNHVGKYRGVKNKDKRRYIGAMLYSGSTYVSDEGEFKYQAGPVALTNTKGRTVRIRAFSYPVGCGVYCDEPTVFATSKNGKVKRTS